MTENKKNEGCRLTSIFSPCAACADPLLKFAHLIFCSWLLVCLPVCSRLLTVTAVTLWCWLLIFAFWSCIIFLLTFWRGCVISQYGGVSIEDYKSSWPSWCSILKRGNSAGSRDICIRCDLYRNLYQRLKVLLGACFLGLCSTSLPSLPSQYSQWQELRSQVMDPGCGACKLVL